MLKWRKSQPLTAALIHRNLDALPLPALDRLGFLVGLAIAETHGRLRVDQVGGLAWATTLDNKEVTRDLVELLEP